jgi:cytochrome c oxidase assembly factor CtaG
MQGEITEQTLFCVEGVIDFCAGWASAWKDGIVWLGPLSMQRHMLLLVTLTRIAPPAESSSKILFAMAKTFSQQSF